MREHYVLEGHEVVATDLMTWAAYFETADRHVGKDKVGAAEVSTVFLGIDHSFGLGPPLLFETMIFGGEHDQDTWRYTNWDQAAAGHNAVVDALELGQELPE